MKKSSEAMEKNKACLSREKREKIVEEGEVPAGRVPIFAGLFEGQRVYFGSLSSRMALEADSAQHLYHSQ